MKKTTYVVRWYVRRDSAIDLLDHGTIAASNIDNRHRRLFIAPGWTMDSALKVLETAVSPCMPGLSSTGPMLKELLPIPISWMLHKTMLLKLNVRQKYDAYSYSKAQYYYEIG